MIIIGRWAVSGPPAPLPGRWAPRDLDANARAYLDNIESSYKYKMAKQHIIKSPNITQVIGLITITLIIITIIITIKQE